MRNKKLIILFSVLCGITLLIVLSSVIFSVQSVQAHCENNENPTSLQAVLDNHGIKKTTSIFMVNKRKVIANVENHVPNVKVLSVEKIFPNKIYINYIEIEDILRLQYNNQYLYCSTAGKIMFTAPLTDDRVAITLKLKQPPISVNRGETIFSQGSPEQKFLTELFESLTKFGYYGKAMDLLQEIDLTGAHPQMKIRTGMTWEFQGSEKYVYEKVQMALTVYANALSDAQRKTGTLILSAGNPPKCFYRASDGEITEIPQNS